MLRDFVECNLQQSGTPGGMDKCQQYSLVPLAASNSYTLELAWIILIIAVVLGLLILVGFVAYRLGYRRACEDMTVYKPGGIIKPLR